MQLFFWAFMSSRMGVSADTLTLKLVREQNEGLGLNRIVPLRTMGSPLIQCELQEPL